jgi:hypothetical protein
MSSKKIEQHSLSDLTTKILIEGGRERYYSFSNQDGKRWIIPSLNAAIALNLYQPVTYKGKLIKQFFPILKDIRFFRSILGIEQLNVELATPLKNRIGELFHINNPEFAVFCGTPSVYRKITIQISSGKQILGYCKLSNSYAVKGLFIHEQHVLGELHQKGVTQVPECLYCGSLTEDIWIFVQTTIKTQGSKVIHKWTGKHWEFLTQLNVKTKFKCLFNDTDLAISLSVLERFLKYLPTNEADILEKAIFKVRTYYGNGPVEFSAYHADFTPWNIFFEGGRLFSFDLEYAGMSFPPYMDFFHYITQISILERNYSYKKTFEYCQKIAKKTSINSRFLDVYLCYLLTVISFYFNINKKVLDIGDKCYSRWFPLVNLIINQS